MEKFLEKEILECSPNKRAIKNFQESGKIAVKSELGATAYNIKKMPIKNFAAFTLAEILLSLTVIGIVAAIALPSLLGNVHERAFETQKKALYTRFSQAIPLLPSLNGYGQLEGTLSDDENEQNVTVDTAAESFVRDGLSKVMKITNICDSEHLSDCGLPDKITRLDGASIFNISDIKSLEDYNSVMISGSVSTDSHEQLNTKAAAFETVNGESVLVYYNPICQANLYEMTYFFAQTKMCANFIYDLNGKKGPNTVGKDIGFITALYSTDPIVVAPNPSLTEEPSSYDNSFVKCKESNEDVRVPSIEEVNSLFYNKALLGATTGNNYWSNKPSRTSTYAWATDFNNGNCYPHNKTYTKTIRCVKR